MERIEMSTRERRRMALMTRVAEGLLKLRMAAEMMRVSYRQAKRIWRRYRQEGDAGLVHRGRGRGSNRAWLEPERRRALALCAKRYVDFGPLLASEHLAEEHGIV
ncbi:MAG: helix-turn-helix domain-containing protein, partial [Opitutae bacterium]|nr:helix-turn-helix domain-containing protein [Opitutae bacterium]